MQQQVYPGETMGAMGNILTNYQDRWTVENPSQDVYYPRLTWGKARIMFETLHGGWKT